MTPLCCNCTQYCGPVYIPLLCQTVLWVETKKHLCPCTLDQLWLMSQSLFVARNIFTAAAVVQTIGQDTTTTTRALWCQTGCVWVKGPQGLWVTLTFDNIDMVLLMDYGVPSYIPSDARRWNVTIDKLMLSPEERWRKKNENVTNNHVCIAPSSNIWNIKCERLKKWTIASLHIVSNVCVMKHTWKTKTCESVFRT